MEIAEAIVRILKADVSTSALSTGGVWEAVADRDAKPPFTIVTLATDNSDFTHDLSDPVRTGFVDVKAITEGDSFASAEPIAEAFNTRLLAVNGVGDYNIQSIVPGPKIRYIEYDGDTRYNHLGWSYRFMYSGLLSL